MVLAVSDRSEWTGIVLDSSRDQLVLDRSHSGWGWGYISALSLFGSSRGQFVLDPDTISAYRLYVGS